jgi:hypothetical protein
VKEIWRAKVSEKTVIAKGLNATANDELTKATLSSLEIPKKRSAYKIGTKIDCLKAVDSHRKSDLPF